MGGGGRNGTVVRRYIRSKEPRIKWSADLHRSFVQAIDCLGGQHSTFSPSSDPPRPFIIKIYTAASHVLCNHAPPIFLCSCSNIALDLERFGRII
jgi:hypothetical protein